MLLSGDALQHTSNTTVAVRDGQQTLTDGPFAETREASAEGGSRTAAARTPRTGAGTMHRGRVVHSVLPES